MGNPVGWFEIYVQDMGRARAFYENVLNVELGKLDMPAGPEGGEALEAEMWAFPMSMESPGASGALVRMGGLPSGGNSTLVYFSCEDCAVEAGRVAAAGGRVHAEKMSIGEYGFVALAFDTEGNLFGLHSTQ
jgi:uncharacterized protein